MKPQISAYIIALNEEMRIADCILSLIDVVDEVIVLDSKSTDRTCEIATDLGAKVHVQSYLGDGIQRNHAAQICRNDWVIVLDADERASPALREFLRTVQPVIGVAYVFPRKNHIGSRALRWGGAYPDWIVRFYNKSTHRYPDVVEHALLPSKTLVRVNAPIIHYGTRSLEEMYLKSSKFARRSAKKMLKTNARVKNPFLSGSWMFIRLYVFKLGMLDGAAGFHFCFSAALRSFYKYAFLQEYRNDPQVRSMLDDKIW